MNINYTTKEPILFYEREFYVCSNFSSFTVDWKGVRWMTSEHAYQAAHFNDQTIVDEIKNARSAHDARKIAHKYEDKFRSDWKDVQLSIMEDIVRAKLSQHFYIQKKLLQTGDREIVEDSPRDSFWGWGPDRRGANNLGKIWMKLRDELVAGKINLLNEDYS